MNHSKLKHSILFYKMHGLGNSFVLINNNCLPDDINYQRLVSEISNKDTGIGCDQIIIYNDKDFSKAIGLDIIPEIRVKIFNKNASQANSCGNAFRCLSKIMFDKYNVDTIYIVVNNKKFHSKFISNDKIVVNMGEANFQADWIPENNKLQNLLSSYTIDCEKTLCVDMGNPHIVTFSYVSDQNKEKFAKDCQNINLLNQGINVNFAKVKEDSIELLVWENATGFTLACGSGACASFAVAMKLNFLGSQQTKVIFPMGVLEMSINSQQEIIMSGPAEYIIHGDYVSKA
ncbi:diaminopimelate epimerase [Rickettsia endosymbiont of Cardiosporidium cionae]|uniref:diaminopimelate epimerase n=1 Tax=Rickettsia endosymbiont of Cardiosporidium cionae TaxID=2777155 RepID=UPI001894E6FB|nr:diaminopimelate epimerase [Rickettsia endosymbiont of Cardiosporidium cionae]KAF8818357.1 tRNA (N(6)-L-threonylcarbamoyladenosine(37)-C(2))-methylthiotransferase MtaB [Rickettsia endosymbiont of Cardiosporidium cionae]